MFLFLFGTCRYTLHIRSRGAVIFNVARIVQSHAVLAPQTMPGRKTAPFSSSVLKLSESPLTQAQGTSQANTLTTDLAIILTSLPAFGDVCTEFTGIYMKTTDGLCTGSP